MTAIDLEPAFGTYTADTYMTGDPDAVWGARLIAPDDLLHNRQDLKARDNDAKHALIDWLNGSPVGTGAIARMRQVLRESLYEKGLSPSSEASAVLVEDDRGIIVGSCQKSYGYVYVTGWLK